MENIIVAAILLAIAGSIIRYLWRAKKRGDACIGCPHGKLCSSNCGGKCSGTCSGTRAKEAHSAAESCSDSIRSIST